MFKIGAPIKAFDTYVVDEFKFFEEYLLKFVKKIEMPIIIEVRSKLLEDKKEFYRLLVIFASKRRAWVYLLLSSIKNIFRD